MCPSLPGSSVLGVFQARILEWVAMPSTRDLPNPGIESGLPHWQVDSFPSEPPGNPTKTANSVDIPKGHNIYRTLHLTTAEYTFIPRSRGTFFKIDQMLVHKISLSKFKKTEVMPKWLL